MEKINRQWRLIKDKRAQNSTTKVIFCTIYYTLESVHNGDHDGVVRIFVALSCEVITLHYVEHFFPTRSVMSTVQLIHSLINWTWLHWCSEQQEALRYKVTYHTHVASRGWRSYTPSVESVVGWALCKTWLFILKFFAICRLHHAYVRKDTRLSQLSIRQVTKSCVEPGNGAV